MSATELLSVARKREDARDRGLIKRSASGEHEALEELFRHYNGNIYHSCLRICRNADDAIEATQETFLSVFKKMHENPSGILSFRDYLFKASRNISLRTVSKCNRTMSSEEMPDHTDSGMDVLDAGEDPERALLIEDQQQIVREASERLTDRHLEALKMYELDGMDYAQIGRRINLETNAVAQLIARARHKLRNEVRYSGVAHKSTASTCVSAMKLMPKKVDGTLTKREAHWLDPHIKGCDGCKSNLSVMEEVGTSYRSLLPPSALIFEKLFLDDSLAKEFLPPVDKGIKLSALKTTWAKLAVFGTGSVALSVLLVGVIVPIVTSSEKDSSDLTANQAVASSAVSAHDGTESKAAQASKGWKVDEEDLDRSKVSENDSGSTENGDFPLSEGTISKSKKGSKTETKSKGGKSGGGRGNSTSDDSAPTGKLPATPTDGGGSNPVESPVTSPPPATGGSGDSPESSPPPAEGDPELPPCRADTRLPPPCRM